MVIWESVSDVSAGDPVLHLRGIGENAAFVGYSIAASDGYTTTSRPPNPGQWGEYSEFYRAYLQDFVPFPNPISLSEVFSSKDIELREYFLENKTKPRSRRERLFYVIQSNRLQCLNGAYLSEASPKLLSILLDANYPIDNDLEYPADSSETSITTDTVVQQLNARVGQQEFSAAVRDNYSHRCCFPGCSIDERQFLVGAHIARWTDRSDLRGNISNGLCLCLMHDKAFERGFYTLDFQNRIWSTSERLSSSSWTQENIAPHVGSSINLGPITPSHEALLEHWDRIELYPE